jgi:hypothetical protein
MCINRFDEVTQEAFLDIFKKMDDNIAWTAEEGEDAEEGGAAHVVHVKPSY